MNVRIRCEYEKSECHFFGVNVPDRLSVLLFKGMIIW
jgi:hypothetical protein